MAELHVHRHDELKQQDSAQTVGVSRREIVLGADAIGLEARTPAGSVSGWHHHGDYATYGYVVAGALRLEFGPGGGQALDAGPGDFFVVPPHTVHREGNPAPDDQVLIAFRLGEGPTVVNVDGPDPA
jgi:uncharacterized RmlC-like cupin family protein